jgi:hypothetical protein
MDKKRKTRLFFMIIITLWAGAIVYQGVFGEGFA